MPAAETKSKWFYVLDEPTRILVVDDDPILREFASVYLSSPLAHVVTVADGTAALDTLRNSSFHIALVDIKMPGMDGFELVERIRADTRLRKLPVVMLTGQDDIASIDRAFSAGATLFATKPVNWRLLSYQLRYIIRASRVGAAASPSNGCDTEPAAQSELAASLQMIADAAGAMALQSDPSMQASKAREVAAIAQSLLRKFSGTVREDEPVRPAAGASQIMKAG